MRTNPITVDADRRHKVLPYCIAAGCTVAATLLAMALQRLVDLRDPALIFLVSVLISAVVGGLTPSLLSVGVGLLSYDYFFVDPLYTFAVNQPEDVVSLMVFLAVAVLTSHLTARIREQREAADEREAHATAIYSFSREVDDCVGIDEVLAVISRRVAELFDARVAILLSAGGSLKVRASYPPGTRLPADEVAAAAWAWTDAGPTAIASDVGPESQWLKLSLATGRGEAAVLALSRGTEGPRLTGAQARLLDAIVRQAAVSIERCNVEPVFDEKAIVDQIIEASEDGILVLDADGRVVHVNTVACLVLAMDRMLVIGRTLDELTKRDPRYARMVEAAGDFLDGSHDAAHTAPIAERAELGVFLRGRDHHYVLGLAPFRARKDTRPGAILSLQDVTYVKDQEARREALVATLSHELRTPLTSLRMAIERIRRLSKGAASENGEIIETAHEDVLRLQEVAQQFLDLARRRAVVAHIEPHPLDVSALIDRSVRLVSLQASEKNVAIETSTASLPAISGDETRLMWALSNLLTNAVRHTPPGGTVRVTSSSAEHGVAIAVEDTGHGIPLEEQERIFEPFAQSTSSGEPGAAGLGLAIVRDIVRMHGGRIQLRSDAGQGACFTIELPQD